MTLYLYNNLESITNSTWKIKQKHQTYLIIIKKKELAILGEVRKVTYFQEQFWLYCLSLPSNEFPQQYNNHN